MPKMLKELEAHPESGFLGHTGLGRVIVQYWRSFEHLEAYARAKDRKHWPAWIDFNRRLGNSRDDVGIWHETYTIKPGQYEAIYSGMPPFGLGKVGKLVPATGAREAARSRMASAELPKSAYTDSAATRPRLQFIGWSFKNIACPQPRDAIAFTSGRRLTPTFFPKKCI
jgi:hypothetical protein